ncbi:MAG: UvrD-helicase domain-containing protein, partial [Planctomycetota bacterium]
MSTRTPPARAHPHDAAAWMPLPVDLHDLPPLEDLLDDPTDDPGDAGAGGTAARLLNGLNDAQRHAVTLEATHLRILAGAGSGKTRVLTHRIAYRADQLTLDPQRTLAVTFTRKAAGELRDRLGRLLSGTTAHAGTFHAIAYAQLRQRWEERGVRAPELLERKLGFVA